MDRLGIRCPTVVTRVTEYIPEIIDNAYAYTDLQGSVYFDAKSFAKDYPEKYHPLIQSTGDPQTSDNGH